MDDVIDEDEILVYIFYKEQFLSKLSHNFFWESYKKREGHEEYLSTHLPEDRFSFWD